MAFYHVMRICNMLRLRVLESWCFSFLLFNCYKHCNNKSCSLREDRFLNYYFSNCTNNTMKSNVVKTVEYKWLNKLFNVHLMNAIRYADMSHFLHFVFYTSLFLIISLMFVYQVMPEFNIRCKGGKLNLKCI